MDWNLDIGSALGSIGSSVLGAVTGRSLQEDAQAFSKKMYKKRHQWEVQDLRKAGLNPILSAGGSPPAVSSGIGQVAHFDNPIIAGLSALKLKEDIKNVEKSTKKLEAETKSTSAIGLVNQINAIRAMREFKGVDQQKMIKGVLPFFESLPKSLRGIMRFGVSSGNMMYDLFKTTGQTFGGRIGNLMKKYPKIKGKGTVTIKGKKVKVLDERSYD